MGKLTAKQVAAAKHPGTKADAKPRPITVADGEGLFLQITRPAASHGCCGTRWPAAPGRPA